MAEDSPARDKAAQAAYGKAADDHVVPAAIADTAAEAESHTHKARGERLLALVDAGVKGADGRWIVRHIDLAVHRGEIVTLIGPNGGGKTTTVRAALGILPLAEGRRIVRAGLRIAYVPQRFRPDPTLPLTVERLLRLGTDAGPEDVRASLARTGVPHLLARPVAALSGGELQRVLIARAILRRPDLLVLDEPAQGVDIAGEAALYELIRTLKAELGCGILMVSHDLHFVMAGTDHVVCINHHVCCQGTPQQVSEAPAYAEVFGPAALAHRAAYAHDHDHTHDADGHVCPLPPGTQAEGAVKRKEGEE